MERGVLDRVCGRANQCSPDYEDSSKAKNISITQSSYKNSQEPTLWNSYTNTEIVLGNINFCFIHNIQEMKTAHMSTH